MMTSKTLNVIKAMKAYLGIVIYLGLNGCSSKSLCEQYCESKSFRASYEAETRCNCCRHEAKRVVYFNRTQALGDFEEVE